MKITSEEFRKDNQILFSAKVLQGSLPKPFEKKDLDVIDVNNNGRADTGSPWGTSDYVINLKEPALNKPYDQIKKFGLENKTEVVTQNDINGSEVKNVKVKNLWYANHGYGFEIYEGNVRSISNLIHEVRVKDKDAKWAIDVAKDEFIIYKPKK